jgi:hypothetical protein
MAIEDVIVEYYIDNEWVEVTRVSSSAKVLDYDGTSGIQISAGGSDEVTEPSATLMSFDYQDDDALFDGENYASQYYRKVGLGMPVRVRMDMGTITDSFTRTLSDDWGTSTGGGDWAEVGAGGTVSAGDWNVTGTTATHSVQADNAYRISYLSDQDLPNANAKFTVTVDSPTGAGIHPSILFRGQHDSSYYMARCVIGTDNLVTISLYYRTSTGGLILLESESVADLLHASATALHFRAEIADGAFRGKAWQGGTEPVAWHCETYSVPDRTKGWVGIRSGIESGNSNVKPLVFTYDNFECTPLEVQATTEYIDAEPNWDQQVDAVITSVETAGILRRLADSTGPLRSPAYRALTASVNDTERVDFWPVEEEENATMIGSPVGSSKPTIIGQVDFGAFTDGRSMERMLTFTDGAQLLFPIRFYSSTEHKAITHWHIPDGTPSLPSGTIIMRINCTGGTLAFIDIVYNFTTDGCITVLSYQHGVGLVATSAEMGFASRTIGKQFMMSVECTQDGADVDIGVLIVDETGNGLGTTTVAGHTIGRYSRLMISGTLNLDGVSFGMVAVANDTNGFANYISPVNGSLGTSAFDGETAGDRMTRMFDEENIPFSFIGDPDETPQVGPQTVDTLYNNVVQAAKVDRGILYEMVAAGVGVEYMPMVSLQNQAPTFDGLYADVVAPFRPKTFDPNVTNDVTIRRPGGASTRYIIPDGDPSHRTTEDPPDGIGIRPTSDDAYVFEDDQLPHQAAWVAHIGSWREKRIKTITFELARESITTLDRAAIRRVNLGRMVAIDTTDTPAWITYDQVRMLAIGRQVSISRFLHNITFNTVPADPYEVEVTETSGSLLFEAIDDSDVTVRLATSLGREWSDISFGETPYDIQVAGQPMRVTVMETDTPTFIAVGTVAHGNNASVVPSLPAGITADVGQLLILVAAIRNSGAGTPDQPSGWTSLAWSGNLRVFGRYYTTGVTAPTVTFTGGVANADTTAQIAAFSATSIHLGSGLTTNPSATGKTSPVPATQSNSSAQNIATPALRVFRDNCLVLYIGWKQDDWTSVVSPGDAEIAEPDTTTGDDQGVVWSYDVQSTATDIAANAFTVTGGASAISKGFVLALRPRQTATVIRGIAGDATSASAGAEVSTWRMGVNGL